MTCLDPDCACVPKTPFLIAGETRKSSQNCINLLRREFLIFHIFAITLTCNTFGNGVASRSHVHGYAIMDEKIADLLLAEYFQIQKVVEDFDAKALTIKAWSVTLSATGIVAGYVEANSMVLVVASVSALIFWLIEALWKVAQQAYYPRIRAIEKAFEDKDFNLAPIQIASSWSKAWYAGRRDRLLFRVALWPHVWLPHIPVAACGFSLFWLAPPS